MFSTFVARALLIWVLVLATVWVGERLLRTIMLTADEPRVVAARGDLSDLERHTIALFQNAAPSVVYIFTEAGPVVTFGESDVERGAGSGVVWDNAGHIVTNHHVVLGADRVGVRLNSGAVISARVVGVAPDYDLAVLRTDTRRAGFRPIPIGRSEDLQVGQSVFAIGNPFGLDRTLTTGVISALDRRLPTLSRREILGVIQTDAAINPGNSGGPLLDSAGRMIGVNTAIVTGTGTAAGISFSVPIDVVNEVVPQLIREGRVPRPGLGIVPAPEELAGRIEIEGVIVAEVLPESSAETAGLRGIDLRTNRLGDVIIAVEGERVRNLAELARRLTAIGIGNDAEITVLRDGRQETLTLEVMDIS